MSDQKEIDLLLQKDWRENVIPNLGTERWIEVFHNIDIRSKEFLCLYSGLISEERIEIARNTSGWNVHVDEIDLGLSKEIDVATGEAVFKYDRFSHNHGIEPLVFVRKFGGLAPLGLEILEDFRFFHDLYFDTDKCAYVRFNESGAAEDVVKVLENKVCVRRAEMKRYLAARQMYLVIFIIRAVYSNTTLDSINENDRSENANNSEFLYRFWLDQSWRISPDDPQTISKLHAKRTIAPGRIDESQIHPFHEKKQTHYEEFILGIDADDQEVCYTCDPNSLGPDHPDDPFSLPDFLVPVWFRDSILAEYSNQPFRYKLQHGNLYIGHEPRIQIDTPQQGFVTVNLGQLGKYLPYLEQKRWRAHNVEPADDRWFRHSNILKFHNNAIRFKKAYKEFQTLWHQKKNWYLFHELADDDSYHFDDLHCLLANDFSDIDKFTLAISKLINDSINNAELKQLIPKFEPKTEDNKQKPKITILQEFLSFRNYQDVNDHVKCLRYVQSFRSDSVAHRKSRSDQSYKKTLDRLSPGYRHHIQVADDIFTTLTDFLDSLREHFCPDESD